MPYLTVMSVATVALVLSFAFHLTILTYNNLAIPEMAYLITMTFATVTLVVLGFLLHSLWQYIAACLKQEAWEHHGQLCCSCLSSSSPGFLSGCTAAKERSTGFSGYLQHIPSTWNNSNWGEERISYSECKWMCHMPTVHVFMPINLITFSQIPELQVHCQVTIVFVRTDEATCNFLLLVFK